MLRSWTLLLPLSETASATGTAVISRRYGTWPPPIPQCLKFWSRRALNGFSSRLRKSNSGFFFVNATKSKDSRDENRVGHGTSAQGSRNPEIPMYRGKIVDPVLL